MEVHLLAERRRVAMGPVIHWAAGQGKKVEVDFGSQWAAIQEKRAD